VYYIGFSSYSAYPSAYFYEFSSWLLFSTAPSSSSAFYSAGGGFSAGYPPYSSAGGGGAYFLTFLAESLQAMISLTSMNTLLSSKGFCMVYIPN